MVEQRCFTPCPPRAEYQLVTWGPPCLCLKQPVQTVPAPPPPEPPPGP